MPLRSSTTVIHPLVTLDGVARWLKEVARPAPRVVLVDRPFPFTSALARGIARLDAEDRRAGSLTLPLGLSLWMQRGGIGVTEAVDAMLDLRAALVEVAGLDRRSEPTPLLAGEPHTAVVGLARYLDDLMARAARWAGVSRVELVEAALELTA